MVDKDGNEVGHDKGGFLIIRRPWPSMMRTIYKDPERYETYWNTIAGVYFAGDAAHQDADGYFWIQGRVDDVIKKSGYRLGSMEIECEPGQPPGGGRGGGHRQARPDQGREHQGVRASCAAATRRATS